MTSTTTKERAITLDAESVRAVLDNRKSQHRVVVEPQPACGCEYVMNGAGTMAIHRGAFPDNPLVLVPLVRPQHEYAHCLPCPLGKPGDRLSIKEDFRILSFGGGTAEIRYAADGLRVIVPSTGMQDRPGFVLAQRCPPSARRITLEITEIQVEQNPDSGLWEWVLDFKRVEVGRE